MKIPLDMQIHYLKDLLKDIFDKVLRSIRDSKLALMNRDNNLAKKVIKGDMDINKIELKIDKICIEILALQSPIAHDLRFLFASIMINNYLERVGDFSSLIAKESVKLINKEEEKEYFDVILKKIEYIYEMVESMIESSFRSFMNFDENVVENVFKDDLKVDSLYDEIYNFVIEALQEKKVSIKSGIILLNIVKGLERMGDYSKNICEQTIYFKKGRIIKHRQENEIK